LGSAQYAQGHPADALASYEASRAIAERLAAADPSNTAWEHDVSVSNLLTGNLLLAQGDAAEALKRFQQTLAICDRLAKTDPHNVDWQRDVAIAHGRIGLALAQQGKVEEARAELKLGREKIVGLKQQFPANTGLTADLTWFDSTLAKLDQTHEAVPAEAQAKP
jgi:tetratricopeptide (TPR) repeat protein